MSGLRASVWLEPAGEAPRLVHLDLPRRPDHPEELARRLAAWIADELLPECPTGVLLSVDVANPRPAIDEGWRQRHLVDLARVRRELERGDRHARESLLWMLSGACEALESTLWRLDLWAQAAGSE